MVQSPAQENLKNLVTIWWGATVAQWQSYRNKTKKYGCFNYPYRENFQKSNHPKVGNVAVAQWQIEIKEKKNPLFTQQPGKALKI